MAQLKQKLKKVYHKFRSYGYVRKALNFKYENPYQNYWNKQPVPNSFRYQDSYDKATFEQIENHRYMEQRASKGYPSVRELQGIYQFAGKRIIDFGCSIGTEVLQMAYRNEVVGVDIADRALAVARQRFELYGLKGQFVSLDPDNPDIPFDDGYFDVVHSAGVLHHIPDPHPWVSELVRVLKPGGELTAMLYYKESYFNYIKILANSYLTGDMNRFSENDVTARGTDGLSLDQTANPYSMMYTEEDARELFKDFDLHSVHLWAYPQHKEALEAILDDQADARLIQVIEDVDEIREFIHRCKEYRAQGCLYDRVGIYLIVRGNLRT